MAGYVDPFAHRLRGEGSREGGGGSDDVEDEVELEIVDLTDEPVDETGGSAGADLSVV